jgi:hypothetical protein
MHQNKSVSKDFRSERSKLPAEAFAYAPGPELPPQDLIEEDLWREIISLPDDVMLRTSDHHGSELKAMNDIWGDWIESLGDEQDIVWNTMLDSADELQACTFNSLCGYYRVAASCLRNVLELSVIGTYFQLSSKNVEFDKWKRGEYEAKFGNACDYLIDHPSSKELDDHIGSRLDFSMFAKKPKNSWAGGLFRKLSDFVHSRPTRSAGIMWEGSNGPIYVTKSFGEIYALYLDTAALSYVLVKLARPKFGLPKAVKYIFGSRKVRPSKVATYAFEFLWPRNTKSLRTNQMM